MPPKRPSTGAPGPGMPSASKQPKGDYHGPDDFSSSVKKKLASSTRTGQACDRCKVRKIRCDGLTGGCSPCRQNNTECRTTDRITGRATQRGYVEGLEHQNQEMRSRVEELEARLIAMGVEPTKTNGYHDPNDAPVLDWSSAGVNGNAPPWAAAANATATTPSDGALLGFAPPSAGAASPRAQETNIFRALPVFRTGCNGDNYLGVSSGNSYLSSIKGTALSVLGMEIDIADFSSSDMDEPSHPMFESELYNKSYQSFLQSAHNVNPKIDKVDLPPRNEGLTYAQWYFRVLNPFCPILHKPSFLSLLTRIYDEPDFHPTPAQTVVVHMMFATMFFQYAARNWENAEQQTELNARSNLHYHYSVGFFHQLSAGHTLPDVQALTMICSHLRNFPKPGASWIVANIAMSLAVELGLHRSAKRWVQLDPQKDVLEVEMRKRVFWAILLIHVTLSGKLGRPMPLRLEDFDVELPEPVDDELLSEAGIDTSTPSKCIFRIGIEAFKVVPLFMEMYSSLYAVRRHPPTYIETVNRLETKLKRWRDQWPTELMQDSAENEQEGRLFSLYIQMWALEFRLLLRHPSISLTSNPEFNHASLEICVDAARQMLQMVTQIQKYKSLDTTWYNGAVYLMAITTTLFAQWEKRNEITAVDLSNLREEMDQWLSIMGDVGGLLGSGNRLRDAVQVVTDGTLGMLSRALTTNTASASGGAVNGAAGGDSRSPPPSHGSGGNGAFTQVHYPQLHGTNGANGTMNAGTVRGNGYLSPDLSLGNGQAPYPATPQYTYPEPSTGSTMTYPSPAHVFSDAAYPAPDGSMAVNPLSGSDGGAPATPQNAANAAYDLFARPSQSQHPSAAAAQAAQAAEAAAAQAAYHATTATATWNPDSQSWRQWTGAMAGNLEPQDCYSASALMQLGGRDATTSSSAAHSTTTSTAGGAPPSAAGQAAPVADMSGANVNARAAAAGLALSTPVPVDGGAVAAATQQAPWPLMIFDMGHAG
ncbi:MAG: hypothetical protein M1838_006196 [Thelocarpon superellum]|nr:MAG: hypothetical protein M1838_006196 [Thelocarpon superellum]